MLYDVGVFSVRLDETATSPATTAVSITLESLRLLAQLDSAYALPDNIPASHTEEGTAQAQTRKGKLSRRQNDAAGGASDPRRKKAAPRRAAAKSKPKRKKDDSSQEDEPSAASVESSSEAEVADSSEDGSKDDRDADAVRRPSSVSSNSSLSNDGGEDEPTLPNGFERISWKEGDPFASFMVWTAVDRAPPAWHCGHVVKVLKTHKRYTHDVTLDGTKAKRGMALDVSGYNNGCWFPIARQQGDDTNNNSEDEARLPEPEGVLEKMVQVSHAYLCHVLCCARNKHTQSPGSFSFCYERR